MTVVFDKYLINSDIPINKILNEMFTGKFTHFSISVLFDKGIFLPSMRLWIIEVLIVTV